MREELLEHEKLVLVVVQEYLSKNRYFNMILQKIDILHGSSSKFQNWIVTHKVVFKLH